MSNQHHKTKHRLSLCNMHAKFALALLLATVLAIFPAKTLNRFDKDDQHRLSLNGDGEIKKDENQFHLADHDDLEDRHFDGHADEFKRRNIVPYDTYNDNKYRRESNKNDDNQDNDLRRHEETPNRFDGYGAKDRSDDFHGHEEFDRHDDTENPDDRIRRNAMPFDSHSRYRHHHYRHGRDLRRGYNLNHDNELRKPEESPYISDYHDAGKDRSDDVHGSDDSDRDDNTKKSDGRFRRNARHFNGRYRYRHKHHRYGRDLKRNYDENVRDGEERSDRFDNYDALIDRSDDFYERDDLNRADDTEESDDQVGRNTKHFNRRYRPRHRYGSDLAKTYDLRENRNHDSKFDRADNLNDVLHFHDHDEFDQHADAPSRDDDYEKERNYLRRNKYERDNDHSPMNYYNRQDKKRRDDYHKLDRYEREDHYRREDNHEREVDYEKYDDFERHGHSDYQHHRHTFRHHHRPRFHCMFEEFSNCTEWCDILVMKHDELLRNKTIGLHDCEEEESQEDCRQREMQIVRCEVDDPDQQCKSQVENYLKGGEAECDYENEEK